MPKQPLDERLNPKEFELLDSIARLIYNHLIANDLNPDEQWIAFGLLKERYDEILHEERMKAVEARRTERIAELREQGFIREDEALALSGLKAGVFNWCIHHGPTMRLQNFSEKAKGVWFDVWMIAVAEIPQTDEQRQAIIEAYRTAKANQELLTPDAAKRMGVSTTTFLKWAKEAGVSYMGTYHGTYGLGYLWKASDVDKVAQYRKRRKGMK